jgi:drug/metabolite transporter (DMT)-like permease
MSIVAPIASTNVVLPVVVGVAGGDRPHAAQVIGIVVAVVGVVLVSRESDEDVTGEARRVTRLTVLLALGAAVGFGAFFVGVRESARYDVLWTLVAARGISVAALAAGIVVSRPSPPTDRPTLLWLTLLGTLDVSANGLFALATRHGLLSVVAVVSSLYPLATVLLARTLLRERVRRIQELGIAAAMAGVALIAAG